MQLSEPRPQLSVLFWNVDLFYKPAPNMCCRMWCENQPGLIPSTQMVVLVLGDPMLPFCLCRFCMYACVTCVCLCVTQAYMEANTHIHLKIKSLKKNRKESQQGFKFILPRVNKVKQARLPGGQLRVVREPVSTAVHSERVLVGPRPCSP